MQSVSAGSAVAGDSKPVLRALRAPQPQQRRVQEALPRMRTDIVAEQRRVVAPPQAVVATILLVGPAGGQVGDRFDLVIDDRLVAQRRADHPEALGAQAADQTSKPLRRNHSQLIVVHEL